MNKGITYFNREVEQIIKKFSKRTVPHKGNRDIYLVEAKKN